MARISVYNANVVDAILCAMWHKTAPEALSCESYKRCVAVILSLAAVLFSMNTGGLPWHDDNITRLVNKIQSGAFSIPPAGPNEVIELRLSRQPRRRTMATRSVPS